MNNNNFNANKAKIDTNFDLVNEIKKKLKFEVLNN